MKGTCTGGANCDFWHPNYAKTGRKANAKTEVLVHFGISSSQIQEQLLKPVQPHHPSPQPSLRPSLSPHPKVKRKPLLPLKKKKTTITTMTGKAKKKRKNGITITKNLMSRETFRAFACRRSKSSNSLLNNSKASDGGRKRYSPQSKDHIFTGSFKAGKEKKK